MNRIFLFLTVFAICSCTGAEREKAEEPLPTRVLYFTSVVSFISHDGQAVSAVEVAVADDDHTRNEGLMDVHHLPENSGMLFIFDGNEPRSFWMANTPIPLDIIFANSEFEIVRIHRNTAPYSHQSFRSEEPAKYVVEVNAGYTLRYDINEGMKISLDD